jgi:carboxylesterase type B
MSHTGIFQSHLDYPSNVTESEFDCLNLFITRPSHAALQRGGCKNDADLPVMVWIHGGAYGFGAASDPPWGMYHSPTVCFA